MMPAPKNTAAELDTLKLVTSIEQLVDERVGSMEGVLAHTASLATLANGVADEFNLDLKTNMVAYLTANLYAASLRQVVGLVRRREHAIFEEAQRLEGPDNGSYDAAFFRMTQARTLIKIDMKISKLHTDILKYLMQMKKMKA